MSLIDIKKLGMELNEMIKNQDEEIKAMEKKITAKRYKQWSHFAGQLEEMCEVVKEICANDDYIRVETDIKDRMDKFTLNFEGTGCVYLSAGAIRYSWIVAKDKYENVKRRLRDCRFAPNLDDILDHWDDQYDVFECRLKEALVAYMKQRAEKANARYEATQSKLKEVTDS